MHLVYIDESGNTGLDLNNQDQPIFVLTALIVPEEHWQGIENALELAIKKRFPDLAELHAEIHATDLRTGRVHFKGRTVEDRLALRDEWLSIANEFKLKLIYRSIVKKRLQQWLSDTFGAGNVAINPHVAAFAFVARLVDDYLASRPGNSLGIFISDENKEIVRDVEESIRLLRAFDGKLKLARIVEKGFFIDSSKSRLLQLCDVCSLWIRKKEEQKAGMAIKPMDESAIPLLDPLVHRGNAPMTDVLEWLTRAQKK